MYKLYTNVKILQMFNTLKCSIYYTLYTNAHPPLAPSLAALGEGR